ncbi:MAG: pilus assembly protein PilM [Candidatus Paceibacterota bacterium]|jgi:type IV pilus assembly protein PilM
MGFFDELKKIAKSGLGPKQKSVVAIDLGISSVKLVQLRKEKGQAVLETYGELACGPYNDLSVGQATNLPIEKTVELLKDLFKEANVTTPVAIFSIPLRDSLIVSIEVPEQARNNLAEVIPIEARKYVPVPISEVMLDWWVIPGSSADQANQAESSEGEVSVSTTENDASAKPAHGRKIEVLVASIHKDSIHQYQEIANQLKLDINSFEIETFSSIRSVIPNDLAATAILDLGAGSSKIAIVDYGIVRLSHTIDKGAQDITMAISKSLTVPFAKAEEIKRQVGLVGDIDKGDLVEMVSPIIEYIFAEANKVMLKYQKEHQRSIDKIVLIGGGALLKGILETAKAIVGVPIVVGLPFDKVEAPAFLNDILKEAGPEFAVAIGLALRKLEDL